MNLASGRIALATPGNASDTYPGALRGLDSGEWSMRREEASGS